MKWIRHSLAAFVIFALAMPAFAVSVDDVQELWGKLTPEQQASIMASVKSGADTALKAATGDEKPVAPEPVVEQKVDEAAAEPVKEAKVESPVVEQKAEAVLSASLLETKTVAGKFFDEVMATLLNSAREAGIGINEFVKTPVGIMLVFGVVFILFGGTLIKLFCGSLLIFVVPYVVFRMFKYFHKDEIEYDTTVKNWRGKHPIKSVKVAKASFDTIMGAGVVTLASVGIGMLTIGSIA